MKYITISEFGAAEVLKPAVCDRPEPGPGQVLIRVAAAGVNRPDILQRQGLYPPPPGASEIPGLEVAGEVIAVNGDFNSPGIGDPVCALLHSGGYAEYAVADAGLCLPVPGNLTYTEAAAIPETFFTVWSNVFERGQLKPGETLLVHGGSSGIGTTAIQLAKAFDSPVFVTAGSDEKCSACLQLGARQAINYKQQDFVDECLKATGGKGVNVILDMVLGDYLERNMQVAAEDGRIIVIAGLGGFRSTANYNRLLRNRLTITGSTLRPRSVAFKTAIAANLKQHVWPLLVSGAIKPVIYRIFPLDQAAAAHRLMESGEHTGKIVLQT